MFENIKVPRLIDETASESCRIFDEKNTDVTDVKQCRQMLSSFRDHLCEFFRKGAGVHALLETRTRFLDHLLGRLFKHFGLDDGNKLVLLAVGGFGRGEMFPGSDVDVFIAADCDEIPVILGEKNRSFRILSLGYQTGFGIFSTYPV